MKPKSSTVYSCFVILAMALLQAVSYYFFIIENNFAPSGINGIATMIQYVSGISISYVSLIINVPLCVFAYFCISKGYGVKSLLFTLAYSGFYLLLQQSGLEAFQYNAHGHDTIFPVIISGVLNGAVCGFCFKHNASSGGSEVISKYISKVKPATNFFVVTFTMNAVIALTSLFVYSDGGTVSYKPVALCITYCFICNFVGNQIIQGTKTAYKFTVITPQPDALAEELTQLLHHGVTKIHAEGVYTGQEKSVLLCVINRHQLPDFKTILANHPDTFSFCESVNETYGNFKKIRN